MQAIHNWLQNDVPSIIANQPIHVKSAVSNAPLTRAMLQEETVEEQCYTLKAGF